jgi:hypothetical protein
MDLDETLVAQAFATSSDIESVDWYCNDSDSAFESLTGTVVVCIEKGKEGPNHKNVGVLIEHHLRSAQVREWI